MFRRDPLRAALPEFAEVLGRNVVPLVPAVRAVFTRGGVLGASRAGRQVMIAFGTVTTQGVFELASVTKPFTAALAGALVREGRLDWDRPLSAVGGPFVGLPRFVTPVALATHTAGLPTHPARAALTTFTRFHDPYGAMTALDVIASVRRWGNPRAAGRYTYSNLGAGLLAIACAYAAGEELDPAGYGRALTRFVTGPLNLPGITLAAPPDVVRPTGLLGVTDVTSFGALTGAGGLYGNASELLHFAQAHLDGRAGWHWRHETRPRGRPAHVSSVAPGWMMSSGAVWHDGVARGTRSATGFHPGSGVCAALLVRGAPPALGGTQGVPALLRALLG